jgi:hypothetical protein
MRGEEKISESMLREKGREKRVSESKMHEEERREIYIFECESKGENCTSGIEDT